VNPWPRCTVSHCSACVQLTRRWHDSSHSRQCIRQHRHLRHRSLLLRFGSRALVSESSGCLFEWQFCHDALCGLLNEHSHRRGRDRSAEPTENSRAGSDAPSAPRAPSVAGSAKRLWRRRLLQRIQGSSRGIGGWGLTASVSSAEPCEGRGRWASRNGWVAGGCHDANRRRPAR